MLIRFHKTAADSYEAASQVMKAGLDVEASSICFLALEEKVLSGEFDVKFIDQAVRRVLRTKFELGLFEDPYQEKLIIGFLFIRMKALLCRNALQMSLLSC